eukprot:CAMPEP_0119341532 /NCGR_PEP_ID=MMETSP1333-20130426/102635_1 /TAXON_ID=418940 /ORGANISM="Scyphosphaera apsteinii, Strain RCC1455" /LENGTH=170 /DNA_ID=CAMNT_0007353527 /DNA_START=166 /DNA_END=679 /DNA_ORIENTATION=+
MAPSSMPVHLLLSDLTVVAKIPGKACADGVFAQVGQDWWLMLVIGIYNLLDLCARLNLRWLQRVAAQVSARTCLLASLLRLLLPVLIITCLKWRLSSGAGNVIILLAVAALALSNGSIATASMMQIPSHAPTGLHEEAVYVVVAGVYLGLASGATASYVFASYLLQGLGC